MRRRQTAGRPMEILMIEDSLTFSRITMGALRQSVIPHRFTWLSDGAEALEFLYQRGKYVKAPRPDLILLDLGLPKIDGREVLVEIKSHEDLSNIPLVIMTASMSLKDRYICEELDVDAYLTKPVDLAQFLVLVAKLRHRWANEVVLSLHEVEMQAWSEIS